jgi:hypothetical protein
MIKREMDDFYTLKNLPWNGFIQQEYLLPSLFSLCKKLYPGSLGASVLAIQLLFHRNFGRKSQKKTHDSKNLDLTL